MPTALQEAIIIKSDGLRISYQQKCEKCGNVRSGSISTTVSSSPSSKYTSSFRCSKCGNNQKIEIKGGT